MSGTRQESGYTLIEVMIALTIFSIGIVGASGVQIFSVKSSSRAAEYTKAVLLASSKAESFASLPFDHPDLSEGVHSENSDGKFTILWNTNNMDIDADSVTDLKHTVITVEWASGIALKSISLSVKKARGEAG